MNSPTVIADRYIEVWNEADPEKRSALLAEYWAPDVTYVDPLMSGNGREEIGALIGGVHSRFPGFEFALIGQPDGHGAFVRFSWALGPVGQEAPIGGSDVVEVTDGKMRRVIGFLDKVPAGA